MFDHFRNKKVTFLWMLGTSQTDVTVIGQIRKISRGLDDRRAVERDAIILLEHLTHLPSLLREELVGEFHYYDRTDTERVLLVIGFVRMDHHGLPVGILDRRAGKDIYRIGLGEVVSISAVLICETRLRRSGVEIPKDRGAIRGICGPRFGYPNIGEPRVRTKVEDGRLVSSILAADQCARVDAVGLVILVAEIKRPDFFR